MKVDVSRIQKDIETLATFNETPGCGVTRSSYTKEDKMAKEYLISEQPMSQVEAAEKSEIIRERFNNIVQQDMITIQKKDGKYQVIEQNEDLEFVGNGGFANVYYQKSSGKIIKKLKDDFLTEHSIRSRFKREYKITKSLQDMKGVIKVFSFDEGNCSYSMERAETTLEKDAATKKLVSQDQIFCNDRSPSSTQTAAWTSTGYFDYGALGRLGSNKTPILTCPTASDKFTSKGSSIGNKKLEYPVGLITADEVSMAGGVYHSDNSSYSNNSSYYLYTNQIYWLGSPGTSPSNGFVYGFIVYSSGYINYYGVGSSNGVRPVISLSSKAKLLGSGTYNDVYTVN